LVYVYGVHFEISWEDLTGSKPPPLLSFIEPSRRMPPMDNTSFGLAEKWMKSTPDRGSLKYLNSKPLVVRLGCSHALLMDERILPLRRGRPCFSLLE